MYIKLPRAPQKLVMISLLVKSSTMLSTEGDNKVGHIQVYFLPISYKSLNNKVGSIEFFYVKVRSLVTRWTQAYKVQKIHVSITHVDSNTILLKQKSTGVTTHFVFTRVLYWKSKTAEPINIEYISTHKSLSFCMNSKWLVLSKGSDFALSSIFWYICFRSTGTL